MDINHDHLVGSLAGVGASILWVFTTIFFTAAGRRIGATRVNTVRIMLALLLHGVTLWITAGTLWPEATNRQVLYLALSGIIGLAICDQALFTAFVVMGPRRTLLISTTTPLFALALGVGVLGERPQPIALLGIIVTLAGVACVVMERRPNGSATEVNGVTPPASNGFSALGIMLALIASAAQATGSLFSKLGMGHGWLPEAQHLGPQPATYLRMIFGLAGMTPIVLMHVRMQRNTTATVPRPGARTEGYALTACGAVFGPYLGVWCSLIAFDRSDIGIAQTLCNLSPVLILPVAFLIEHERITRRAAVGAIAAVAGSAILFIGA